MVEEGGRKAGRRGLVPGLLEIDHLPTKSRPHPVCQVLVLTCRGWGVSLKTPAVAVGPGRCVWIPELLQHHQSRPRAEFEKLVLTATTFPLPARASQGLSLFTFLQASHRDPWAQAKSPTQPWFPTALPALGLPSPSMEVAPG